MNGKEQTLYVKYLFPFKYQQLNSASFLKSLTDFFGLGSLGGSILFLPVLTLSTGFGFWFPCLSSSLSCLCLCQYFPLVSFLTHLLGISLQLGWLRMNWTVRLIMLGPVLRPQVPGWKMLKALSNLTTQLSTSALALLLPRKSNQLPGSGSLIPSRFSY